ncbi:M1-specific T cell receptor beta chain-like [Rhincodon typus]|uniref:M1-specific T cell receptor beta chain-like n=1 Tax=Rhincodon typus TaxID=259920 RepID=UPI00202F2882|nr:M1-specific T cell receptor beta chain-like [Rhincodon typus]
MEQQISSTSGWRCVLDRNLARLACRQAPPPRKNGVEIISVVQRLLMTRLHLMNLRSRPTSRTSVKSDAKMRLIVFGGFLLALSGSRGDEVRQWPTLLALNARGSAEMNCVQEGTLRDNMLWYRQSADGSFTLIGYIYLAGEAQYEEGFKSGFSITRTMENKKSTLKIDSVKLTDSAIYFCAASTSLHNENYFGQGTKLTVLAYSGHFGGRLLSSKFLLICIHIYARPEHDVKDPVTTIFGPSPGELKDKKKATVVCLVTAFYPDNIKIHWVVDGTELLPNDSRVQTDRNSTLEDGNKSYSISSRFRLPAKDWAQSQKVECKVDHYQQGTEKKTKTEVLPIKAEICGISKENKMHSMKEGKLMYLILTCKSVFYGIFISIIAWKTKTSYSKIFD